MGNALEGRLKNCRGGLNSVVVLYVLASSSLDEANARQLSNLLALQTPRGSISLHCADLPLVEVVLETPVAYEELACAEACVNEGCGNRR